ncbi:unnamed protein product [Lepeophtheirus salmonis]|uniref:(salmon louse) hypothetical protein n=1 Tax=Lepeophtheirus salmonis TaxID=72036 RepID=A0A7R8CBZ9_LEPSM|nr:unnamed protein product [Lepeophtheirus salmonis]CAF2764072.1 unnamed protein product [Lepeophtheirus salmonis]
MFRKILIHVILVATFVHCQREEDSSPIKDDMRMVKINPSLTKNTLMVTKYPSTTKNTPRMKKEKAGWGKRGKMIPLKKNGKKGSAKNGNGMMKKGRKPSMKERNEEAFSDVSMILVEMNQVYDNFLLFYYE